MFTEGFEQSSKARLFLVFYAVTSFFLLCGLAFVAAGLLPVQLEWIASVIIFLVGVTTFLSELRYRSLLANCILFVLLLGLAFLVEFVGVTTGFPFGSYLYTDVLGFRVMDVPIAIAFAWYATVMNTRRIAEWIQGDVSPLRIAFVAAILTLALDLVLEPTAAFIKSYWTWNAGVVPPQNYVSWFMLGFLAVFVLAAFESHHRRKRVQGAQLTALALFGLQFLLFAATNTSHGFLTTTVVSLMFVAAVMLFRTKHQWYFAAGKFGGK